MCESNQTTLDHFLLVGFTSLPNLKIIFFTLSLIIYIAILIGNFLIIVTVSFTPTLHCPMYTFLKHLALADVLFTTNILPNMLHIILNEGGSVARPSCFLQYYIHSFSIFAQSLILTAMAFDRYLAICYPLAYSSIMDHKLCFHLIFWSWGTGFILIPSEIVLLFQLEFCGSNTIDHFFCDVAPILQIASSDTFMVLLEDFLFGILVIFLPFVLILISYICIFVAILKISTVAGKHKAFSTCSSHLSTVCLYYGTLIAIYMVPINSGLLNENKLISLLYTVLTPFLNPILYSMRNQEIRRALRRLKSVLITPHLVWAKNTQNIT